MSSSLGEVGSHTARHPTRKTLTSLAWLALYTALVVALTAAVQKTIVLGESVRPVATPILNAIWPVFAEDRVFSEVVTATTGGTSNPRHAGRVDKEMCVYAKKGKLVPDTGTFVVDRRSGGLPIVGWKVISSNESAFCVHIWASTGAKEDQRYIVGRVSALEKYQVK